MTYGPRTDHYIEVSHKYETAVDNINEALAFVVANLDNVGPQPQIHIHPAMEGPPPMMLALLGETPPDKDCRFHVVVEGTVREKRAPLV